MVRNLSEPCGFRHFDAAASCREVLCNRGYGAPGWRVLPTAQPEGLAARVPGVLAIPHEGWQRDASSFLEQLFLDSVLPRVSLMSAHCSAPKEAPLRPSLSQQCRSVLNSGSTPTSFVCSCCGASVFLFPCPTLAGVAVLSTALAITVQVVLWQVCWGGGVLLWSLRQHAYVMKLELECPLMCSCEILIWLGCASRTNDASR